MKRQIIGLIFAWFLALVSAGWVITHLTACNTVKGAGEDIESAGEGIQGAAEGAQHHD
jgi:predicted small secreted protein